MPTYEFSTYLRIAAPTEAEAQDLAESAAEDVSKHPEMSLGIDEVSPTVEDEEGE